MVPSDIVCLLCQGVFSPVTALTTGIILAERHRLHNRLRIKSEGKPFRITFWHEHDLFRPAFARRSVKRTTAGAWASRRRETGSHLCFNAALAWPRRA